MIQLIQLLVFITFGIAIYNNIKRAKERNSMNGNDAGNTMSNQTSAPVRPAVPVNRNAQMGGLAVAERYLDGDLIPQGKQRVKCGYCGADNLLPMQPRTRYSCYFCREALS